MMEALVKELIMASKNPLPPNSSVSTWSREHTYQRTNSHIGLTSHYRHGSLLLTSYGVLFREGLTCRGVAESPWSC